MVPFTLVAAQEREGEERRRKGWSRHKARNGKVVYGKGDGPGYACCPGAVINSICFHSPKCLIWMINCMVTQKGYRMSKTIVARQKSFIFAIKMEIAAFVLWVVCFGSDISVIFTC